ncbi:Lhr family ATP-dependent helicase, partial [Mycobacterium palustre]|uniref:Lhr family ATP-dependent helicase n=1 Tax=Mycobacterium palustre TaxID=153971 RepID=UPI003FD8EE56
PLLAALRAQVEPVSTAAYGRFLPAWHRVGTFDSANLSGLDGLMSVIDQLAGVRMPASAIEPLVLGPRVRDYSPAMLDELLASGEVTWSGGGAISSGDGWIALHPSDSAPLTLAGPAGIDFTDAHRAILDTLAGGGAYFFRQLAHDEINEAALKTALWELVWAGWVTGDTFAPIRAMLGGAGARKRAAPAHRADEINEAALKTALWELVWAGWVTGDTFAPIRAMLGGAGARKRAAPAHRA